MAARKHRTYEVNVPRKCDRCGALMGTTIKVKPDQAALIWPYTAVYDAIRLLAAYTKKNRFSTFRVFCSKCKEFTKKATQKHFAKGFKPYLVRCLKRRLWLKRSSVVPSWALNRNVRDKQFLPMFPMWVCFAFLAVFGLVGTLSVVGVVRFLVFPEMSDGKRMDGLLAFFVMGLLFNGALAGGIYLIRRRSANLRRLVDPLADKVCRRIVIDEYHRNHQCLGIVDFGSVFRNTSEGIAQQAPENRQAAINAAKKLHEYLKALRRGETNFPNYAAVGNLVSEIGERLETIEEQQYAKLIRVAYSELRKAIDQTPDNIPRGAVESFRQVAKVCDKFDLLGPK